MSLARQLHPASGAQIAVWLVNEIPARAVHRGVRYRVTDTPTRLEDDMAALTHPLPITGWRFQGTDPSGRSLMFDVRRDGERWALIRTYE